MLKKKMVISSRILMMYSGMVKFISFCGGILEIIYMMINVMFMLLVWESIWCVLLMVVELIVVSLISMIVVVISSSGKLRFVVV